jgi:hemerythrin-like domain-containing protein
MHPANYYHEQHAEILAMVEDLRPLLNKESLQVRMVAKTAQKLLCDIAAKLKEHLAEEDKELYPSLLTHPDAKVRTTAWGFINGQHALRQWTEQYSKKWLKDCNFEFTDDFLKDTEELLRLLAVRVDREERVLYPRLEDEPGKGQSEG